MGAEIGSVSDASLQQDEEDAKGVLVFGSKRPPSPRVDPSLSVTAGGAAGTIATLAMPVAACFCFLMLLSRTFPPLPFALVVVQAHQPPGPGRCRASSSSLSFVSLQSAWRESKRAKRAVRAPRRSTRSLNRRNCSRLVGCASGFVSGFASGLEPPPPPPPSSPPSTVRRALLRCKLRFCIERETPRMPPSLARARELCSGAAALPPPLRLRRRHCCQPNAASRVPPPKYTTTHTCDDKETADGDRDDGNVGRGGHLRCGGQGYCGG